MPSKTKLESVCGQISKYLRELALSVNRADEGDALLVTLHELAQSTIDLPNVIVECLGGGRIKKLHYARTEPAKDNTEKSTVVESYSVEYEKGPDSFGRGLLLALFGGLCVLIVRLFCCTQTGEQSTQRNPGRIDHSISRDQNQYVFVEGGDWFRTDGSMTIPAATLDQKTTNALAEAISANSTEETNRNVQQTVP